MIADVFCCMNVPSSALFECCNVLLIINASYFQLLFLVDRAGLTARGAKYVKLVLLFLAISLHAQQNQI